VNTAGKDIVDHKATPSGPSLKTCGLPVTRSADTHRKGDRQLIEAFGIRQCQSVEKKSDLLPAVYSARRTQALPQAKCE
jgi:hypothetical protein